MKNNKEGDYMIVYVFGPENCHQKYADDIKLTRENGEWVKIGETVYNGKIEGLNSKVQLAKGRARGFRCVENFINMIYFINGGNVFRYPLETL